jgi:hypothetical protein
MYPDAQRKFQLLKNSKGLQRVILAVNQNKGELHISKEEA